MSVMIDSRRLTYEDVFRIPETVKSMYLKLEREKNVGVYLVLLSILRAETRKCVCVAEKRKIAKFGEHEDSI